jgi:hypothetical protein
MLFLFWLTFINVLFLAMAFLSIWKPITFEDWLPIRKRYNTIVAFCIAASMGYRFAKRTRRVMTPEDLEKELYGQDPANWAKVKYNISVSSFFTWQIIITIALWVIDGI